MEIPKEMKTVSIGSLMAGTFFKFSPSDEVEYAVVGKLPTNENLVCYCSKYNYVYATSKYSSVYTVK